MAYDDGEKTLQVRARLAGFLFLAVNAFYIASLLAGAADSDEMRRVAVAFQAIASAATIALAWAFYELLKQAGRGLALLAPLFRTAGASLLGVPALFRLLVLNKVGTPTPALDEAGLALLTRARFVSFHVANIYFCAGAAIFFYLLFKSRFIPRAISAFGIAATILGAAYTLAEIGAPAFAGVLTYFAPLVFLAETMTGGWLIIVGARLRHAQPPDLRDPPVSPI